MKKIVNFGLTEVLKPLARRLGSVMAGSLVAFAATQPQVDKAETLITSAILLCIDLFLSYRNREIK